MQVLRIWLYVKILSTSLVTHGSRGHGGTQADVIALNPHFTGEICRKLCFHSENGSYIFGPHHAGKIGN